MNLSTLHRSAVLGFLSLAFLSTHPVLADSSHARIIRLSLIEGDVRFARDVHGDPLTAEKAVWDRAELNLPIRQGYVLATDNGRAAVEFENGAMALLGENTVLEFYDLSLEDGAKNTRLVLRQGTASFYVTPSSGDYFSVTGGDFTVEAPVRATFRINDSSSGSVVSVSKGHISVLRKKKTMDLAKGQSFSMRADDDNSINIVAQAPSDDFDHWVSSRIESVTTATASSQQYINSPNYTSGLADLYNYGAWFPVAGYGNCWRPYGVGYGWSPFVGGGWLVDSVYGLTYLGGQPWGWMPYHYGGWILDPSIGWMWVPPLFYGPGYVNTGWTGATGVFLRSKSGPVGIVPVHPLDVRGKPPINLAQGVFPVNGGSVAAERVPVNTNQQWKTLKSPSREVAASLAASSPLTRVTSPLVATSSTVRSANLNRVPSSTANSARTVVPARTSVSRAFTPPAPRAASFSGGASARSAESAGAGARSGGYSSGHSSMRAASSAASSAGSSGSHASSGGHPH
jgi:FecR protein